MGILGLVIPMGLLFLFTAILENDNTTASIAGIIGGLIVFFLGKKLNAKNSTLLSRSVQDNNSPFPAHSLFWVEMELWGIFFIVLGISVILSTYLGEFMQDFIYYPILFGLLILGFLNRRKEKKLLKQQKNGVNTNNTEIEKEGSSKFKKAFSAKRNAETPKTYNSEKEMKRAKTYQQMKSKRNNTDEFKPSNPNDFMPK